MRITISSIYCVPIFHAKHTGLVIGILLKMSGVGVAVVVLFALVRSKCGMLRVKLHVII